MEGSRLKCKVSLFLKPFSGKAFTQMFIFKCVKIIITYMYLLGQPFRYSCLISSGSQKFGSGPGEASSNTIPNVFSFLNFHLF